MRSPAWPPTVHCGAKWPNAAASARGTTPGRAPWLLLIRSTGNLREGLLLLFFRGLDGNLQGPEKFLILRGEPDLARRLELQGRLGLMIRSIVPLVAVLALVEPDRGLEHQEHIVPGALDLTNSARDTIGVG